MLARLIACVALCGPGFLPPESVWTVLQGAQVTDTLAVLTTHKSDDLVSHAPLSTLADFSWLPPQEGFDEDLGTCFTCPSDSTGAFGRFCRCNDPSKQVLYEFIIFEERLQTDFLLYLPRTSPMGVRTCGCSDGTTSCICSASQYRNTVSNACKTCVSIFSDVRLP